MVLATLLGLGVYLVLELLFGPYGLLAYQKLERFHEKTVLELIDLNSRSRDLHLQVRMLTTDSETVRLEARDIGLVGANDVVLRLENRDPRPRHRYMPGTLPPEIPRVRDNRPLFRSVGFAVFLVMILAQLAGTRNPGQSPPRVRPAESDESPEVG